MLAGDQAGDAYGQLVHGERLGQQVHARLQLFFPGRGVVRVAGNEQHLQAGPQDRRSVQDRRGRCAALRRQSLLATKSGFTAISVASSLWLRNGPQDRRSGQDRWGRGAALPLQPKILLDGFGQYLHRLVGRGVRGPHQYHFVVVDGRQAVQHAQAAAELGAVHQGDA